MADRDGQISVADVFISFEKLEPTDELMISYADRLEAIARRVGSEILEDHYEIVVVVSEGSIKEHVSLLLSIASLASGLLGIDYTIAQKNLDRLFAQSSKFTQSIVQHERRLPIGPDGPHFEDRSVIVRTRMTALDRLRALLKVAEEALHQSGSRSKRIHLVEQIASVLRVCPGSEEKRELLQYLWNDPNIEEVLRVELGIASPEQALHLLTSVGARPVAKRSSDSAGSPVRRRRKRIVRRVTI